MASHCACGQPTKNPSHTQCPKCFAASRAGGGATPPPAGAPTTPPPSAPSALKIGDTEIKKVGTNFEIKIEVITKPATEVRMRKGLAELDKKSTDVNGERVFTHTEPETEAGKTITLTFRSAGVEAKADITLPDAPTTAPAPKPDEPETLYLRSHSDCSTRMIFTRVVNSKGVGIANKQVRLIIGTITTYITTDACGNAEYNATSLAVTTAVKVRAAVSGIKEEAAVTLQPLSVAPTTTRPSHFWNKDWWKLNNNRAKVGLLAMILFWFLALGFGFGKPILSYTPSKSDQTRVSEFQEIQKQAGTYKGPIIPEIPASEKPSEFSENAKGTVWFIALMLTILAPIYCVLSWREELAQAIRDSFNAIFDRNQDKADDPMFEKIGNWAGNFKKAGGPKVVVTNPTTPSTPTTSTPTTEDKSNHSFLKLISSDILAELVTELLPRLFKIIFGK